MNARRAWKKLVLIGILAASLTLLSFRYFVSFPNAGNMPPARWYFIDRDVGMQLVENADNVGKSIVCPTPDDCKVVYYDKTNGDLRFFDCDDTSCSSGTATTIDSDGNVGEELSIYCPSPTDCKVAYYDTTQSALLFFDCDDATCSTGTRTVVDGDTGCGLTGGLGCDAARIAGHYPVVACPSADDCKIAYAVGSIDAVYFADCDDAACSHGTINVVDGKAGCGLAGCVSDSPAAKNVGEHTNMYCVSATDCKIVAKEGNSDDLRFEDCDDATCSTGTSTLLDGNIGCSLIGGDGCSSSADVGKHSAIYCPSSTDCKVAYISNTNTSVRFADCDNSACTAGSVSYIDGEADCSLGNCSINEDVTKPRFIVPRETTVKSLTTR